MLVHTVFDLLAWIVAAAVARWIASRGWLATAAQTRTLASDPYYYIVLGLGALAGAIVFGSANLELAGIVAPGHSIAGALVGGIVAIEIYKWVRGERGSTGAVFVAPLAAGIAVGRVGCFLAGLPDYTYGVPSDLPWSVDFGDGIPRHPVQLYESAAMLGFLVLYVAKISQRSPLFLAQGFYLFTGWYAVQRFMWEFLKPYPKIFGPFNLFHILCFVMLVYSLVMIGRNRELRSTF